jgi:hypothetical protein
MFVSQEKFTPIFDVFIKVELIPAVLINGSKYEESYVEELLGRFTMIEALRDQSHKVFPKIQREIASWRY